jgi:hypothetical protein
MKEVIAPILTFVLFVGGLLAWRLQLLDKRRFEVAEQVLVLHAKLTQRLSYIRTRPDWSGFKVVDTKSHRDHYRQMRRYYYAIPAEKMAAWDEVYKEHAPTVVLAGLYLTNDIRDRLILMALYFERVRFASIDLVHIEPEPSIDKEFIDGEPRPEADEHEEPDDEAREDKMREIEEAQLPIRFWSTKDGHKDEIQDSIRRDSKVLNELCKPYKSLNPWRFLQRYLLMFVPSRERDI